MMDNEILFYTVLIYHASVNLTHSDEEGALWLL